MSSVEYVCAAAISREYNRERASRGGQEQTPAPTALRAADRRRSGGGVIPVSSIHRHTHTSFSLYTYTCVSTRQGALAAPQLFPAKAERAAASRHYDVAAACAAAAAACSTHAVYIIIIIVENFEKKIVVVFSEDGVKTVCLLKFPCESISPSERESKRDRQCGGVITRGRGAGGL